MKIKRFLSALLVVIMICTMIPQPALAAETGNCFISNRDCTIFWQNKTLAYAANVTWGTTDYWIELWSDVTTDGVIFAGTGLNLSLANHSLTGNITVTNGLKLHGNAGSSDILNGTVYVTGGHIVMDEELTVLDWEFSGGSANFEPAPEDLAEGYEAVDNGDGTWSIREKSAVIGGSCGDNVTWTLDENGLMTISGTGEMSDFSESAPSPWQDYADSITGVAIESGVTTIGNRAFFNCQALAEVTIADTVVSIGDAAFCMCMGLTHIDLPDGVTYIGESAFDSCVALTEIVIPAGITYIAPSAFWGCMGAETVNIPEGVVYIGRAAFASCGAPNLTFPSTLHTIGDYAFQGADLTSVTIPDGVTAIGEGAFSYCTELTDVTWTGNAPSIRVAAFEGTTVTAHYPADNTTWTSDVLQNYGGTVTWEAYGETDSTSGTCGDNVTWTLDENGLMTISGTGAMYNYSGSATAPWAAYKDEIQKVVIGEGVTSIGSTAFSSCANLTSVSIADSVTAISYAALADCTSLTSIAFPEQLTEIAYYALADCTSLTQVTLPVFLQGIDVGVFKNCTSLSDIAIPDAVSEIAYSAFENCSALQEVTMPYCLEQIGDYAFAGTSVSDISFTGNAPAIDAKAFLNLTATASYPSYNSTWTADVMRNYGGSITWTPYVPLFASGTCGDGLTWQLDATGVLTISGTGAMYDYSGSATAPWEVYKEHILSIIVEENVTTIGSTAFSNCFSLKSVTIPSSVTEIAYGTFENCTALRSVAIPDSVTSIAYAAFTNCRSLAAVELPANLTAIGESAFSNCTALQSIAIPTSVTEIAYGTFENCTALRSVAIPDSVTSIAYAAFTNCRSLAAVELPTNLTAIGESAFSNCTALKNIAIPASVTEIAYATFANCRSLAEVTLPANLSSILDRSFANTAITELEIPSHVNLMGDALFDGCSALTSVKFLGDAPSFAIDGTFKNVSLTAYYPSGNDTWTSDVMQNYGGAIEWVPYMAMIACGACGDSLTWELGSDGVLTISGEGAMYSYAKDSQPWADYRDSITAVVVEEKVTGIGDYAFENCDAMETISIASTVTTIGQYAFYDCNVLNNVVIPEGVTALSEFLFYNCDGLVNLQLPSTLRSIGRYSLADCQKFDELVIPEGVTSIGTYAFYTTLWNTLSLPDSLVGVGDYAFCNSGGIRGTITTPKNVEYIGTGQYHGCGNLKEVIVADGVNRILMYSFQYCYNLRDIWIPESVTTLQAGIFKGCTPANITIHGYAGSAAQTYAKTYGFNFEEINPCAEGHSYVYEDLGDGTHSVICERCTEDAGTEEHKYTDGVCVCDAAEPAKTELEILAQPADQTAAVGDSAAFTVEAAGDGLTYQWQYSNNAGVYWYNSSMSGYNTNAVTMVATEKRNGQLYRCVITDAYGNQVTTDAAELIIAAVAEELEITAQPVDQTATVGDNVTFTVSAAGEGLTYQWQYSTSGIYWFDSGMTGNDTDTLTVEVLAKRDGQQYRCVITDASGKQITSDAATLSVGSTAVKLEITSQPEDQTAALGKSVTFTVEAAGESLTYQWQYSNNGGVYWYNSSMGGYNTNTVTMVAAEKRNGQLYRCVITDASGEQITSAAATLTIDSGAAMKIVSQPTDQTASVGEDVVFAVEATGENLTYQWQYSTSGIYWFDSGMTGNQTSELTVTALAKRNGQQYRCVITDADGNTLQTNVAALIIE